MKQTKLFQDCDIIKEELTLSDSVRGITNRTECITFIDLNIAGVSMKRWKPKNPGSLLKGKAVTFVNLLHEPNRHREAKVTVTAVNLNSEPMYFQITFDIDSSNCSGIVEETDVDEEKTEKPGNQVEDEADNSNLMIVTSVLGFALLVVIVILIIVCLKKRCCMRKPPMKHDVNDTYGTYARGWDSEGEYGDGDKVYVTDTNDYYAAS